MRPEIEKLNKQIIFSNKATQEAREAAILDMYENKVKAMVVDKVADEITRQEHPWYKYKAMESCVLAYIGPFVDKNYDSYDALRTEDELFQEGEDYQKAVDDR